MEKRVIGYFDKNSEAEQALRELKEKGYNEISILGNEKNENQGRSNDTTGYLSNGTMTGGAIGGLAGLALGAGALFIPGIGPILALGPLAATLSGAVTGGIAGALVDYGIPQERSDFYETKVREGNTVMVLKTDERKIDEAAGIMRNHGAKDVEAGRIMRNHGA
jgi:uncharacterized membrane protein